MVNFYCVKCREKVEIPEKDCEKVNFRKGIKAWKSKCKTCGTAVYRIIGKSNNK